MKSTVFLFILLISVHLISMNSDTNLKSLVYIFDTTDSMNDNLEQVRKAATKIFKTLSENKRKIFENYILLPVNDNNTGPYINIDNMTEFENLINKIEVSPRGGCPKISLKGIKTGLEFCLENSFVYVFTDADPKDKDLLSTILELIHSKKAQVLFFLTGKCSSMVAPEYETIAAFSSGHIFNLSKHDIISELENIPLSLLSELDNVAVNLQTNQTSQNSRMYNVSVDDALKEITTMLSGNSVSISFTDPSGQLFQDSSKIRNLLDLEKVKVVSIQTPMPGTWNINVGESKHYILRVTGQSDFNFIYGFALGEINSIDDTDQRPSIGSKNKIFIAPSNGEYLSTLNSCEIIAINGTVMQTVLLMKVDSIDNLYYGTFLPNQSKFYVRVTGETKKGMKLQRISRIAINPIEATDSTSWLVILFVIIITVIVILCFIFVPKILKQKTSFFRELELEVDPLQCQRQVRSMGSKTETEKLKN